jgi:hypothetical protein
MPCTPTRCTLNQTGFYASIHPYHCQRRARWSIDGALSAHLTTLSEKRTTVAQVSIQDGIIKITELEIQDPKAAAVLSEYPEVRWAEITRRALKIGLGYLKGGEKA